MSLIEKWKKEEIDVIKSWMKHDPEKALHDLSYCYKNCPVKTQVSCVHGTDHKQCPLFDKVIKSLNHEADLRKAIDEVKKDLEKEWKKYPIKPMANVDYVCDKLKQKIGLVDSSERSEDAV